MQGRQGRMLDQSGAVIIVTGVSLMLIMGMAGLALDLGHMYVIRTELQRAADAGAMAGARALFIPKLGDVPQCAAAETKAWEISQANYADGASPEISTPSGYGLPYGNWNWSTKTFSPGCFSGVGTYTNAVTLRASRSNISLIFMGVFGHGPRTISADALAVMDGVGELLQGASFVLALSLKRVKQGPTTIYLSPYYGENGGWYAKAPDKPSAGLLRGYLDNPQNIPAIKIDEVINLSNGEMTSALKKVANYVGKTVWMPVVDVNNFNQSAKVLGFTVFRITEVVSTGSPKYIEGVALKTLVEAPGNLTGPGGPDYGLFTAPRLAH